MVRSYLLNIKKHSRKDRGGAVNAGKESAALRLCLVAVIAWKKVVPF